MAETIESFVAKLKSDGVEQGRQQADSLVAEARTQAEDIIAQAKAEADKIIADAKKEGEVLVSRTNTELELAARDAAIKLRETLSKALEAIIAGPVDETLNDGEFLKGVITDIMSKYVESDIQGTGDVMLKMNEQKHHELAEWAVKQIRKHAKKEGLGVDLKGTLKQAGFEYNISGATVEMTQEAITETLMSLVGPKLREVFNSAVS